jgi:hypothetical protein
MFAATDTQTVTATVSASTQTSYITAAASSQTSYATAVTATQTVCSVASQETQTVSSTVGDAATSEHTSQTDAATAADSVAECMTDSIDIAVSAVVSTPAKAATTDTTATLVEALRVLDSSKWLPIEAGYLCKSAHQPVRDSQLPVDVVINGDITADMMTSLLHDNNIRHLTIDFRALSV